MSLVWLKKNTLGWSKAIMSKNSDISFKMITPTCKQVRWDLCWLHYLLISMRCNRWFWNALVFNAQPTVSCINLHTCTTSILIIVCVPLFTWLCYDWHNFLDVISLWAFLYKKRPDILQTKSAIGIQKYKK